MSGKITKRRVDALKAGETLYDDEVKGFVVRKLPSGASVPDFGTATATLNRGGQR